MTTTAETPRRRGRPRRTESAEIFTAPAALPLTAADVLLPQRYPAEAMGTDPSPDTLEFFELYHGTQAMVTEIAHHYHARQLEAVRERRKQAGLPPLDNDR